MHQGRLTQPGAPAEQLLWKGPGACRQGPAGLAGVKTSALKGSSRDGVCSLWLPVLLLENMEGLSAGMGFKMGLLTGKSAGQLPAGTRICEGCTSCSGVVSDCPCLQQPLDDLGLCCSSIIAELCQHEAKCIQ